MPMLAAAMVAAPIVGGLVGNVMAQGDRNRQRKAMKEALAELESVGLPPDLSKEIIYQKFQQVGIMTPQLEEDLSSSVAESQMAKVEEDPGLKKAQLEALSGLQRRAKVGLSAEDRAALNQVRTEVQRDAEAKRQQVLQQMQARGMGGSGAALVAQLQAGQDAQNLASQQADTQMAQAQQRALQALGQSGEMAGQMQQAQFGRQADIARAVDERNRFLAENAISRQQRNVSALNEAQLQNLREQQRIADANIQQANQEKLRQVAEQGSLYDRTLGYKQSLANARLGQATQYGQQAQNTAQSFGQMGAGVGTAAGAIGSAPSGSAFSKMFSGSSAPTTGLAPDAAGGTTQFSRDYLSMPNYISSDEDLKENIDESGDEVNSFLERIAKKYK